MARHFKRSLIVQLQQRLFLSEGTEELTAILLADERFSHLGERGEVTVLADTLVDLEKGIGAWGRRQGPPRLMNSRVGATFLAEEETEIVWTQSLTLGRC